MQKYDFHGSLINGIEPDKNGDYYLVTEVDAVIDTLNLIADKASRWAEDAEARIRELTKLDESMCSRLDAANAEIAALKEKLGYRQKECESWAKNFHALDKNYDTLQEETDKEIAALQEHHDIYKDLSIALQKMVNDKEARIGELENLIPHYTVTEALDRKDAEIATLRATIESQGRDHTMPCSLGSLCPWCEIAALKDDLDTAIRMGRDLAASKDKRVKELEDSNRKLREVLINTAEEVTNIADRMVETVEAALGEG